ncbi:energy transducer TonB [Tunturibacter empetritectus]|uniref:Protein TonB n=1 Tax=Tunturiibacter empetritectus TaxID=3069691 RepID=A0A7W8IE56_9BACT|nr:energy transducer TonB [Edaphobacter lichenicola]MBB5315515.1 protein TonB [Edaphobacter lichenicola]
MFEESLVESRVGVVSSSKRWTTVASIGLQFAFAGLVIALPLLHPEVLPFSVEAPKMLLPLLPKPPAPPLRVERVTEAASSFAAAAPPQPAILPARLPGRGVAAEEEPSLLDPGSMGMPYGLPIGLSVRECGPHPGVSVGPGVGSGGALHKTINVSTGVSQGLLIAPIRPVYPAIARAAHVEGTVVVEAVISRGGTIESLHVLSGPVMLQSAAMDAIRVARYRPYRLNGEAVDVQTTITVNFRMGG